jgi:hypothetical protein
MTKPLQPAVPEDAAQDWPQTVAEAVASLLQSLGQAAKDEIAATPEDELIFLHYSLGASIRNHYGLWEGNAALLADCQRVKYEGRADVPEIPEGALVIHSDDASMVIIRALWARLRH